MRPGMQRYIEQGIRPGDFMTAVLSNDLFGAFGWADDINRRKLFDICAWLYNHAPAGSYGSPKHMQDWIDQRRDAVDAA
jgi:hypothetical protein